MRKAVCKYCGQDIVPTGSAVVRLGKARAAAAAPMYAVRLQEFSIMHEECAPPYQEGCDAGWDWNVPHVKRRQQAWNTSLPEAAILDMFSG